MKKTHCKTINIPFLFLAFFLLIGLTFSACKIEGSRKKPKPPVPALVKIEITNEPNKITYVIGQELNLTGLVVTAFYDDETDAVITGYTVSGFDPQKLGLQDITVSYGGKDAVFTVEVKAELPAVARIEITNPPDILSYTVGEELDLSGLVITAFYGDETDEVITGYTVSGFDPQKLGLQDITISYGGKDAVFTVEVKAELPAVARIEITNPPDILSYMVGEKLDLSGLVITAFYDDETDEVITGYTVSGFDPQKLGLQDITISYGGKDAVFTVQVNDIAEALLTMVKIPAGDFTMGSPSSEAGRSSSEGPQRKVELSGFYMGKYPVTQAQYEEVTGENPSAFTTAKGFPAITGEIEENRPVEMVNWYEALVFCNLLSKRENLSPAYSIAGNTNPVLWGIPPDDPDATWDSVTIVENSTGYRLPTEAQWEYACRAGTASLYSVPAPDGSSALDNTIGDAFAWHSANSGPSGNLALRATHEVGLKLANAWDLYDMYGNVNEWCWDWYDVNYYTGRPDPDIDPQGPAAASTPDTRSFRGGTWMTVAHLPVVPPNQPPSGTNLLRSAARNYTTVQNRVNYIGFRVVCPE